MRVYRRRRVFTIIIFLTVIGIFFLAFQVISVQVLNLDVDERLARSHNSEVIDIMKENSTPLIRKTYKNRPKFKRQNINRTDLTHDEKIAQKNAIAKVIDSLRQDDATRMVNLQELAAERQRLAILEEAQQKRVEVQLELLKNQEAHDIPRGASPTLAKHKLYKADTNGMFRCLQSGEKILFAHLNDDYCDCKDGSDEPGTSACKNSRFYCRFQLNLQNLVSIPSSNVNDGICDCCDASDEWRPPELPLHVVLPGGKPAYGLYQWPCKDHCRTLVEVHMLEQDINHQGAAIRRGYIADSQAQNNPNNIYGKEGEFFPLSTSCYYSTSDKYTYDVCPFVEVKQRFQGTARYIAKNRSHWVKQDAKSGFRLKMMDGDSGQCPLLKSRLTFLDFSCGLNNKVLSVQETEVCEYTIKFETPAVCVDVMEGP